jgi:hypothetical protein
VLRDLESQRQKEEVAQRIDDVRRQGQIRYDARIDEIARAIKKGQTIRVAYDASEYGGKSPMLDLFKLYDIKLPLRTQGWVKTGLAEISDGSYRYFKSKHKRNSTAFIGYLKELQKAIEQMPIEEKRASLAPDIPAPEADGENIGGETPRKEENTTVEHAIYAKFAERFPRFMSGEFKTLRLEAPNAKPLELKWILGELISIAHIYELNGKPAFEPKITLQADKENMKLQAISIEISDPPRNDAVYFGGIPNIGRQQNIHNFLTAWLERMDKQNFLPVVATIDLGGVETTITFDADGNALLPPPQQTIEPPPPLQSEPSKQYEIHYGHKGNGLTVWNMLEEKYGDYVTVAHISPEREVTFYDKDMPDDVKAQIEQIARTSDARVSASQDNPVFRTPPQVETEKEYDLDYGFLGIGITVWKELAAAAILTREPVDNAIAAEKGLKPYTFLNVELNDGSYKVQGGYIGWYYVTLAVDGKIFGHLESGLVDNISRGDFAGRGGKPEYFVAGALPESSVDYVFGNVGFSSASGLYHCNLSDAARARAEKTLAARERENEKISRAAAYIVETSAFGTMYGNYITYPGDIPDDIMTADEFEKYRSRIADELLEYEAVAQVDLDDDGSIDVTMHLAYCPNYIPDIEERDQFPDDREILDALKSKVVHESKESQPERKPSLLDKLELNKQRVAAQARNLDTGKHTPSGREV